ncbi:Peptide-N(4)-(N-acetyl-beta-glucosaminyl)asparagine amidase [Lysobacter dokdonensis DS-58]|uniref:Peptide-N(4)-(N-acetyl-beta-glucosaminyl)asparagine amidase n=1 Tax=Lysobacter dokdonensis DS-58 TaxID=1300345 RepID=A0A0A2WNB5_9GAMM|nr:hypothetical protein [Lysobacter dokdonensis]KGQ19775.1 Peptide-N(4)-(N-acetyl-beta-glucosaminyl)asparagine amidase [Lysobacter dokdonensis DS-58]
MNGFKRAAWVCAFTGLVGAVAFAALRDDGGDTSGVAKHATASAPRATVAKPVNGPIMEILSSPTGPLSVEPTVPRPDTKPCVVTLLSNENLMAYPFFDYSPPAACPGPWAKIVFEMDMTHVRRTGTVANVRVALDGGGEFIGSTFYSRRWDLFVGAPQISAATGRWHVERDLTHYAWLLAEPEELTGGAEYTWDNSGVGVDDDEVLGTARLLFYPPSPTQPAPRVPDAVLSDGFPYNMPRNIVRAYVEVIAQGLDSSPETSDRFWYTCLPDRAFVMHPGLRNPFAISDDWGGTLSSSPMGCGGGSYRQVVVEIDGVPVGTAPLMPWLPNNFHRRFPNTLDPPLPGVQALNFIPYHVDVTPFAAYFNTPGRHMLTFRMMGDATGPFASHQMISGKMFIYRDPKLVVVPGAITAYAMEPALGSPTGSMEFTRTGDVLRGTVVTRNDRTWMTEGYVDTSDGRITTRVQQRNRFDNRQQITVEGDTYPNHRGYMQFLQLQNRVDQVRVSVHGAAVVAADARTLSQPLQLYYAMAGIMEPTEEGGYWSVNQRGVAAVDQARDMRAEHWRGATRYSSALRDHFYAQRYRNFLTSTDTAWRSQRDYAFIDSLASCFTARRESTMGVLTLSTTGVGCPGGVNDVIWHARPDGSPEMMGRAE